MHRNFKIVILLLSLCTMYSCENQDKGSDNSTLFPTCDVLNQTYDPEQVSEFLNCGRIVRLETNDSSLIGGRFTKILKRDTQFYVRSFNDVIVFDSAGNYLRKLSKVGNGKDEYATIEDYDVIDRDNGQEIWIASQKDVLRYDSKSFDYLGKISTDDYVNKFFYVNDTTIITETPGEQTLRIIDIIGNVRKTYLDKDVANLVSRPVQFRKMGDSVIYHIESTDKAVVYSPADDSFSTVDIIPDSEKLLSVEDNREYYDKYGYMEFPDKIAENFITISSFQMYGPQYVLTSFHPDGSKMVTIGNDKGSYSRLLSEGVIQLKDGITVNSPRFLLTTIACDSDRGLLFMIPSEDIEGENPDANPSLLDIEL